MLRLRLEKEHRLDGAISIQEVSRTRSTDVCLNAFVNRIRATAAATLLSNTTAPPPTANATTANASTTNYAASSTSTEGRLLQSYFSCTIRRACSLTQKPPPCLNCY